MSDHATCDTDAQILSEKTKKLLAESLLHMSQYEEKDEEEEEEEGEEDGMEIEEDEAGPAAGACSATAPLELTGQPALREESQVSQSMEFHPKQPMPGPPMESQADPDATQADPDATQANPGLSEATQEFTEGNRGSSGVGHATMELSPPPRNDPAEQEAPRAESALPAEQEQQSVQALPAEQQQQLVQMPADNMDDNSSHHTSEEARDMEDDRRDAEFRVVNELVQKSNAVAHHELSQGVSNPAQAAVRNAVADYMTSFDVGSWSTPLTCHSNGFHSLPAVEADSRDPPVEFFNGLEIFIEVNPLYDKDNYCNETLFCVNEGVCQYMTNLKSAGCVKTCGRYFFPFVVLHSEVDPKFMRNHEQLKLWLYPSDHDSLGHLNTALGVMPMSKKKKLLETPQAFWASCHAFLTKDQAACQKRGGPEQEPVGAAKQAYAEHVWPRIFQFITIKNTLPGKHFINPDYLDSYFLKAVVLSAYVGPHRLSVLQKLLKDNPPTKQHCQAAAEGGPKRQNNAVLEALMKSINMGQKKRDAEVHETDFWLSKLPEEGEKLLGILCHNLDFAELQLLEIQAVVSDMQDGRTKSLLSHLLQARLREIHDHRTGGSPDSQIHFRDLTEEMGRHALALKVMGANVELRRTAPNLGDGACDTVAGAVLTRAPSHCELIARLNLGSPQFQKELDRILDWHSRRTTPPGDADPWEGVSKKDAVERFVAAARAGADRLKQAQQGAGAAGADAAVAGPDTEKNREFVALCMAECIGYCLPEKDCEQRKTLTDSVELYLGLCHSGATRKFLTGDSGADVFNCTVCYLKSEAEGKEEGFRGVLESAHDGLCDAQKVRGAIQAAQAFLAKHADRNAGGKKRRR